MPVKRGPKGRFVRQPQCRSATPEGPCQRTDLVGHPRGGTSAYCSMHESVYITCECCDELYVSTHAETKRLPVTDAQRRDGGIDFLGLPICDDCVGHDLHSCQDEKDVEDDTNVAERWGDPS